ncbi:MAG: pitrilysin family protein, partial [Ginsengibacter sp.]
MTFLKVITAGLTGFVFVLMYGSTYGQIDTTTKIPVDPKVKIGKLDNGLTYYIRQNKKPEQKVELRLVVNAGSTQEDDDQQGLAHLSEHMAFNGTTNFKKNDIVSFLQDIGVGFGNDLNAYTSFNETVYILPIPTDKPGNIEKGFQVLEDWSRNVTYNNEDIDGERPVVLEESRLGKGADDRMNKKLYPKIFAGSIYGKRLPIGLDSIIKNSSYDAIKRFYHEWYRPDLMAVLVVGDIEPVRAEELIKKHFNSLENPAGSRPRTNAVVPFYASSEGMVVTDKEATDYSIIYNYSFQPDSPEVVTGDYRQSMVKSMFTSVLNQRLRELTQKENPPFLFAYGGFASYARGYESFGGEIGVGSGDPVKGLEAYVTEVERLKKYGATAAELERIKKMMLSNMERAYNERDKTESQNYISEYIRNFLVKEPIPGIETEYDYYKAFVPSITLDEVNAIGKSLVNNNNKFVALTGPEPSAGKNLPTGEELLAKADDVEKTDTKPYEEKALASSLMASTPKAGKIVSSTKNTYLGTTELKFGNGVTVTLKSTDFKNDQVLMSAVRAGGKNNYGLNDKYNADNAVAIVSSMGIANFNPADLRKVLAGKTANAIPAFTSTSEGISGNSSLKDIETMLQLTYLYFTAPRKDTSLFNSFIQKSKSQTALMGANPQTAFVDTLYKTLFGNNPLGP